MSKMGNTWLEDPDVRLMLAVKTDRPGAFEELVERYSSLLVNFLFRQIGSREAAEDLAQEVFLKVFRARSTYQPAARFKTWILTIATNLCLNLKRYERHRFHHSLDARPAGASDTGVAHVVPGSDAEEPGGGLERLEIQRRVRDAVSELPEKQRIAVSLLRFEGLSYREIGGALGLSVQAVKSLLNRAKDNLRERLGREVKDYLAVYSSPLLEG